MSIYGKPLTHIALLDLQELLDAEAVENVRLEFKREPPKKGEMLKKLSSFANTFGGFLVVGAEADSKDGRIKGLPGVVIQPSYKQTIIQWCFEGVSPPLNAEVSEPIALSGTAGSVCYVIFVGESDLAPHFLNSRKGVYVRTDEFSAQFEPQLANENELRHLLNRRELILRRRTELIDRARTRFRSFTGARYVEFNKKLKEKKEWNEPKDAIGARFDLSIIPRFPSQPLCDQVALIGLVKNTSVPWRGVGFPQNCYEPISQHESAIVATPGTIFSMLEANVWGLFFFASELHEQSKYYKGIHLGQFLGSVLAFLKYTGGMLNKLGFTGELQIEMHMEGMQGVPWVSFSENHAVTGPHSELDDLIRFGLDASADDLLNKTDATALQILRVAFLASNWESAASSEAQLQDQLKKAYTFNWW